MVNINTPYQTSSVDEMQRPDGDRLPLGSALLAVLGLSLLGWATVLLPAIAILH
jgi:hypothetical protein